jgi:2-amino-4-hydroxy-6-hydroxymethyldihydropteridine diphosphokinase
MSVAFVALGSNLGDREAILDRALERLAEHVDLGPRSRWIETEPVGGPPQGLYLNGVVRLETALAPRALLELLHDVERELGRVRSVPDAPRTLDLDLLLYDDRVIDDPGLRVPHPRLHLRRFVLEPLCEIAPDLRHPESGRTMRELLEELEQPPLRG